MVTGATEAPLVAGALVTKMVDWPGVTGCTKTGLEFGSPGARQFYGRQKSHLIPLRGTVVTEEVTGATATRLGGGVGTVTTGGIGASVVGSIVGARTLNDSSKHMGAERK